MYAIFSKGSYFSFWIRIRRITTVARKRNVIFVLTFVRIHVRISPVDVVFGGYALSTIWRTGSLVTTDFAIRAARRRFQFFKCVQFFFSAVLLPSLPTRWMNPLFCIQHNTSATQPNNIGWKIGVAATFLLHCRLATMFPNWRKFASGGGENHISLSLHGGLWR